MIKVTRLNGKQFVMNAELIRMIESTPDTVITLLGGDHIVVREPMDEVVRRAIDYARSVRAFQP